MAVTIEPCTFADLENATNFPFLISEYEAEAANKLLPPCEAKFEMYRLIEASGIATFLRAVSDGELVGLLVMLTPELPHYGRYIATTESFFVLRAYRSTGAGLALLRAAEAHARALKSPAILVSAPVAGALAHMLDRLSEYKETNRVFCKVLA